MTVHRSGNPEAQLASYVCADCNRVKEADLPPKETIIEWLKELVGVRTTFDNWERQRVGDELSGRYLPPRELETRARAEVAIGRHDQVQPEHDIHLIFFDGRHPTDS